MKFDVVGSFLPPASMLSARNEYDKGAISAEAYASVVDDAVRDIVDRQIECGLKVVTSGELRRRSWNKDFYFGLDGISVERVESGRVYQLEEAFTDLVRVTGKIGYNPEHPFFEDYMFLQDTVGGRAECRQTIPSPADLYLDLLQLSGGDPGRIYPYSEDLTADISEAYRQTIMRFYDLGCRNLQLDDTACGKMCDLSFAKRLMLGGVDTLRLSSTLVQLIDGALESVPDDMTISIYMSAGTDVVPEWSTACRIDSPVEAVFSDGNIDAYFLPFNANDDKSMRVLASMAPGKDVVLGLVTAHSPYSENPNSVRAAVCRGLEYIPAAHLGISHMCGFKISDYASRGLVYGDQWRKIESLESLVNSFKDSVETVR